MADDRIAEFWDGFVAAGGPDTRYTAWHFGADDDPGLQTELALLVRHGPKRATAGVLAEYENENEELPAAGDFSVILDGRGDPQCIIRTTHVEVRAFGEVDEGFAWTEGEGDRTLAWWKRAHQDHFARAGVIVGDDTEMVLERFELVWPTPSHPRSATTR
ncbi:MAG: ASCH domain-containing protein [Acidimicrobiia bacterium]|nr:ASCH domain-containing protein [Acidimicrobiia bacterium]